MKNRILTPQLAAGAFRKLREYIGVPNLNPNSDISRSVLTNPNSEVISPILTNPNSEAISPTLFRVHDPGWGCEFWCGPRPKPKPKPQCPAPKKNSSHDSAEVSTLDSDSAEMDDFKEALACRFEDESLNTDEVKVEVEIEEVEIEVEDDFDIA